MSKAILVMDMPSCCYECKFILLGHCSLDLHSTNVIQDGNTKPDWCPLREVPKKQSLNGGLSEFQMGARSGYNACIDEIMKGSEENG